MPLVNLRFREELTLADGLRARVINTGNVSVAYGNLDAGAVLPEHYSARAVTDVFVLDVFHPVREDFVAMLDGTGEPNSDE